MKCLKWLWFVLIGEQGEGEEVPANDPGAGEPPVNEPSAGEPGNAGQPGEEPPKEAKYGEFGDAPTVDDLYAKVKELLPIAEKHKVLSGQAQATEKNLSAIRKTLERYGLKVEHGEDGEINLSPVRQEPQKRQSKFAKEHEALFDSRVLQAIQALIEDKFEDFYEQRTTQAKTQLTQQREFNNARIKSVNQMFKLFPQLDGKWGEDDKPTNSEFDANFHKRAEEIWKEHYSKDPAGELRGAIDAALEMNIPAKIVAGAEKTGYQKGKEGKKILGTVQPKGQGAPTGKKLSQAEYLKLDPQAREKYDREQKGI